MSPAAGIALVPEDRRNHGLLLTKSVRENLTLAVIPRVTRFGLVSSTRERTLVEDMLRKLQIKAGSPDQWAGTLSGGNQQKVIFGKMLLTQARILLFVRPDPRHRCRHQGRDLRDDAGPRGAGLCHPVLLKRSARNRPCGRSRRRAAQRAAGRDADLVRELSEHRILSEAMAEAPGGVTDASSPRTADATLPSGAKQPGRGTDNRGPLAPSAGPAAAWDAKPGFRRTIEPALLDRAPFLVACLMLAILLGVYGALRPGVFTLDELNTDTAAALTFACWPQPGRRSFCCAAASTCLWAA